MWSKDIKELGMQTSDPMYNWLVKVSSITKSVKQLCEEFHVDLMSQDLGKAYSDEQQLLNINETDSLIRQVHLNGDGVAWSYGRVIVPHDTYQHFKTEFDTLGNRSIGEVLLHSNPSTIREPLEYARVTKGSNLFNLAVAGLEEPVEQDLWARRSIFSIDGYKLLVVEVYLPEMLAHRPLIICPPKIPLECQRPKPRL
jgi:chorismate--pyruvate lyase